jgi:hypothetical protein
MDNLSFGIDAPLRGAKGGKGNGYPARVSGTSGVADFLRNRWPESPE